MTNRLSVAVASSESPTGDFTDHGPLVAQELGSIDAFEVRDEKGTLYLLWKEDGNSQGMPTPMWAQEINEERKCLLGSPTELFRNDWQPLGETVDASHLVPWGMGFRLGMFALGMETQRVNFLATKILYTGN